MKHTESVLPVWEPCSALRLSHFLCSSFYLVLPNKTLGFFFVFFFQFASSSVNTKKFIRRQHIVVFTSQFKSAYVGSVLSLSFTNRLLLGKELLSASVLSSLTWQWMSHGVVDGLNSLIHTELSEHCLAHSDGSVNTVKGTLTLRIGNEIH